jgi:hypothetical protein
MCFPFPVPIVPGSGGDANAQPIRDRLREYVNEHGITIRDRKGREIEIDEMLDEALGPAPKIPKAVVFIALGLLALLIAWIVIVLTVLPR